MNLIEEVTSREAERIRKEWGSLPSDGLPGVQRNVAVIVADVLDILSREGRFGTATWNHGETPSEAAIEAPRSDAGLPDDQRRHPATEEPA